MPLSPPAPTVAFYHLAADVLELRFDRGLISGATAAANWHGDIAYDAPPFTQETITPIGDGQVLGKTVTVPMQRVGVGDTDNTCDYAASPADVISQRHVPAVAFTDFPLTVV